MKVPEEHVGERRNETFGEGSHRVPGWHCVWPGCHHHCGGSVWSRKDREEEEERKRDDE
jgi:hypothetical protein